MFEIQAIKRRYSFLIILLLLLVSGSVNLLDTIVYTNLNYLIIGIVTTIILAFLVFKLVNSLSNKIIKSIVEDDETYRELRVNDEYDHMTRLYSNKALREKVREKIDNQPNKIGGMLFIDIDNIKYINDNYGYELGDCLILKVGEMLRYFDEYDALISRTSGDEFVVYIHGFDTEEEILNIFKGIYSHSEKYHVEIPNEKNHQIRFSAGIAWYPRNGNDFKSLYKLSDFALYEAKNTQKGSMFEFSEKYYEEQFFVIENRVAIDNLIDNKLIKFAYQPIVDIKNGEVFAYEALMRSKLDSFKNPLEILHVAAKQSKLPQLEALVAFAIYEDIELNKDVIGDKKIFLNSIPSQMLSHEDGNLLAKKYGKYFNQVVVEITEQENNNALNMVRKIEFCREHGLEIAVDDFGSGFSNEVRVLEIGPDIVKIDMNLIQGICKDSDKQYIVTNILKFCRSKKIKVVAEGVEELEDLKHVIKMGIDYVQGYYLAKPSFGYYDIPKNIKEEILQLNAS